MRSVYEPLHAPLKKSINKNNHYDAHTQTDPNLFHVLSMCLELIWTYIAHVLRKRGVSVVLCTLSCHTRLDPNQFHVLPISQNVDFSAKVVIVAR